MSFPEVVYMITHNVTKRRYIGKTNNLDWRIYNHLCALRARRHSITDMQRDFDLYGENYSVEIIDTIECFNERVKEREAMDKYRTCIRGIGYNYMDPHVNNRRRAKKEV